MKKLSTVLCVVMAAFITCAFAAETPLIQRHGNAWPKSEKGYVTKYQCQACHGDYQKLGDMTKNLNPNPHRSHMGEVNCEECHKPNQSQPTLMCNSCHQFTIKK